MFHKNAVDVPPGSGWGGPGPPLELAVPLTATLSLAYICLSHEAVSVTELTEQLTIN